ncbi:molecular chaperone GrpE [Candidatus Magnetomoraceae bacterium gMMP-15]
MVKGYLYFKNQEAGIYSMEHNEFQKNTNNEIKVEDFQKALENSFNDKLSVVQQQLVHLHKEFQAKLKYDAQKDKIIDNLHKELQEYKSDVVKKCLQSMVMDVIKTIDGMKKLAAHYRSKDPEEKDFINMLKILEIIPSDLEDIFAVQGIFPFTCDKKTFDPVRQRVIKKIETSDQSKDKTIAKSLHSGYEWEGRVIRPEMVAVYVYIGQDEL